MTMRLICLLMLFISSIRADWDQLFSDEEDPSLFHHVNVITGNLNLCMEDGVIEGAKPFPIFRTYSSAGALEPPELNADLKTERGGWVMQGGWNFFPHANLWIDLKIKLKDFKIYLAEPSGNLIPYFYSHKKNDHIFVFKPNKDFGVCSGNLSAKTNVSNNELELDLKHGIATLLLPSGGSRIYKGKDFRHWDIHHWRGKNNQRRLKCCYQLIKEVLPSKHKIQYTYDKKDSLVRIALTNPSETKIFAWMDLKLIKKDSPFMLSLKTSDGKSLEYKTTEFKEIDYISGVKSCHRPEEEISYIKGRKGIGARIKRMDLAGRFQFEAQYYTPPNRKKEQKWAEKPEEKGFEIDKVRLLEAPLGLDGETIPFARFSYRPGVTEARGIDNLLTRYRHDDGHLSSIEYCNEQDKIVSVLKFLWEGQRLKAKLMLDGDGRAYFSKVFEYDPPGNVIQETLWGSLTGEVPGPFSSNNDGSLQNAEHYTKRYAYLPVFNLPLVEEEENGLTYLHVYKSDTDLPAAKFTCYNEQILIREFLFYNEDNLLVAEMTDDGDSTDPNDVRHVTLRQIRRYELDASSGQVRTLTESYLDTAANAEILLRKVTYNYSPEHRLIAETVEDAEGVYRYTIHTDYDVQGRVVRKTTPLGQENTYTYDSLGNLLFSKEVSAPQKTYAYDPAGRPACVEESDHLGTIKKTFTRYDAKGNLVSQTDSRGNITEQCYNAFGKCVGTQFPVSIDQEGSNYTPVATFEYDLQGNLSLTSVEGGGTTQTIYNSLRKPVQITQADGTILRHRYNKDGTLAKTIYPDGTYVDYLYDMFQRQLAQTIYSADGELLRSESWTYSSFHLLSHTDPNGLTTYYTYDGAGRKTSERAESRITSYNYDSLGFLEKTIEADVAHVQIHDVGGRVIEEWKESSDGRIENHMWFSYDEENRKTQAIRLTSRGEATDFFFYDRESRLTRHVNPEANVTEILYNETETNALGQCILQKTTIDPRGNHTVETHDALNRITSIIQKDPSGNIVSKEELFYDREGNRSRKVSCVYQLHTPKSQISVRWEYDPMGRVIAESEEKDKTTYFTYDARGRVIKRLLPNGVAIHSIYDGIDRLLEMESSDGTIHYKYTYARGSEPIEVADLIQHTLLHREYNAFGQIVKEINPYGLIFTWQYDHHGRCVSYTLPDLSSISYLYKGGHLAEVSRYSPAGGIRYTHRYQDFDPNGHIVEEELIHQIGMQHTTYDLLERPIHQQSNWLNQTISYGPSSLVTQIKSSLFGNKSYSHDAIDQLIQEGEEQYAFDSLGNPIDCSVNKYNQITAGPNFSIEYDRNGNPIRRLNDDKIIKYTYDALNRLTSITHPNATKTTFFYDAFSRLIAQEKENFRFLFLYDKSKEIGLMNTRGDIVQLKVIGLGLKGEIGGSVAIEIGGTAYVPLHDFQGNIIALVSSKQKIVESYQINAFGREKSSSVPLNPWRFSSKRSIEGLVFFGQRFYDPALGRWLTPDPSGFADGSNLYAYVLNSPLNRLDLFGLISETLFPQDTLRMEIPLHVILPAIVTPINGILPCKGFLSEVPVDWVVSCGHWHKLQFTPQEWKTNVVNIADHFHELVPEKGRVIGLITAQNGICTTKADFTKNVQSITSMVPEGTFTIGIYNPTQGLCRDNIRAFKEKCGKDTPIVVTTRQFMVAISGRLHKINPELLWMHIAHSEGGVIGRNAIKGMTSEQRDLLQIQLYCLGLGPAAPIPLDYGLGVKNIYSNQDFITMWFALRYKNDSRYDIKFVPCSSTWSERTGYFADHASLGGTYRQGQQKFIDNLRIKHGFYDEKTR